MPLGELLAVVDQACQPGDAVADSGPTARLHNEPELVVEFGRSGLGMPDLIRQMGPYLTHSDALVRRRATNVLACVLEHVLIAEMGDGSASVSGGCSGSVDGTASGCSATAAPNTHSSSVNLAPLLTFFCSRLGDYPSIGPCLRALSAIADAVPAQAADSAPGTSGVRGAAVVIAKALFAELNVQAMEQPLRQRTYALLHKLLTHPHHRAVLAERPAGLPLALGSIVTVSSVASGGDMPFILEFAVGFVSAVDGEKDPRCLMLALDIARALLSNEPPFRFGDAVASYTGELFDVVACYFPITFTPPPNDPYGITREVLIMALRRVFAASPRLAGLVLPLLLEKLASSVPDAKRDALQTLRFVAEAYGAPALGPHLSGLAEALKAEILRARETAPAGGSSSDSRSGLLPSSVWLGQGGRAGAGAGGAGPELLAPGDASSAGVAAAAATAAFGSNPGLGSSSTFAGPGIGATSVAAAAGVGAGAGAGGSGRGVWSVGLSAGAIGLNFSGSAAVHANSGYSLYTPLAPAAADAVTTSATAPSATAAAAGTTASAAAAAPAAPAAAAAITKAAEAQGTKSDEDAAANAGGVTAGGRTIAEQRLRQALVPGGAAAAAGSASAAVAAAVAAAAAAGAGGSSLAPPLVALDTPILDEALFTVAELTRLLSVHAFASGRREEWDAFVAPLVAAGVSEVSRAAESLLGRSMARILCAVASASHHALAYVLDAAMPVISRVYVEATAHRRLSVRLSVVALLSGLLHTVDHAVDHPPGGHPFAKHLPAVLEVLLGALTDTNIAEGLAPHHSGAAGASTASLLSLASAGASSSGRTAVFEIVETRCVAAAGLCDLAIRPPTAVLALANKAAIVAAVTHILLRDEDDTVREACLRALCTMASVRQRICDAVLLTAVPTLLRVLQRAARAQSVRLHFPKDSSARRRARAARGSGRKDLSAGAAAPPAAPAVAPAAAASMSVDGAAASQAAGDAAAASAAGKLERLQLDAVEDDAAGVGSDDDDDTDDSDVEAQGESGDSTGGGGGASPMASSVPSSAGAGTATSDRNVVIGDMHMPGVSERCSRAVYALGQLACISNARAQAAIVPALLRLAVMWRSPAPAAAAALARPRAVLRTAATVGPGPAPADASATAGAGAASASTAGTGRRSSSVDRVGALSAAIVEALARTVVTKASVGDALAVDAFILRRYRGSAGGSGGSSGGASTITSAGASPHYHGNGFGSPSGSVGADQEDEEPPALLPTLYQVLVDAFEPGHGPWDGLARAPAAITSPTASSSASASDAAAADSAAAAELERSRRLRVAAELVFRDAALAASPAVQEALHSAVAAALLDGAASAPASAPAPASGSSAAAAGAAVSPAGSSHAAVDWAMPAAPTGADTAMWREVHEALRPVPWFTPFALATASPGAGDSAVAPAAVSSPEGAAAAAAAGALLPVFLKPLMVGRRGGPAPRLAQLLAALSRVAFALPFPVLASCEDPQQRYVARTRLELSRRSPQAASVSSASPASASSAGAAAMAQDGHHHGHSHGHDHEHDDDDDAMYAEAAASAAGGSGSPSPGVPSSAAAAAMGSALVPPLDMQRAAVLTSACLGALFNRAPLSCDADKAALNASLADVAATIASLGGPTVPALRTFAAAVALPGAAPAGPASAVAGAGAGAGASAADASAAVHSAGSRDRRALERAVLQLVWLCKGLAMRGHAAAMHCAAALVDIVTSTSASASATTTDGASAGAPAGTGVVGFQHVVALAGRGLGAVMADAGPKHPFSKEAGATSIGLYKQRLWAFVHGRYRELSSAAAAATAAAAAGAGAGADAGGAGASAAQSRLVPLLLSLCAMATHLPEAVLVSEADSIVPLVIRALDILVPRKVTVHPGQALASVPARRRSSLATSASTGGAGAGAGAASVGSGEWPSLPLQVAELRDAVAGSALSCLRMLLGRSPSCLAPHVPSLAPLLLSLASLRLPSGAVNPYAAKPVVRAAALACLRSLLVLPYHKLHPVRQTVIAGLVLPLDDPKRAVRRRAAACRSDWITIR